MWATILGVGFGGRVTGRAVAVVLVSMERFRHSGDFGGYGGGGPGGCGLIFGV